MLIGNITEPKYIYSAPHKQKLWDIREMSWGENVFQWKMEMACYRLIYACGTAN